MVILRRYIVFRMKIKVTPTSRTRIRSIVTSMYFLKTE